MKQLCENHVSRIVCFAHARELFLLVFNLLEVPAVLESKAVFFLIKTVFQLHSFHFESTRVLYHIWMFLSRANSIYAVKHTKSKGVITFAKDG